MEGGPGDLPRDRTTRATTSSNHRPWFRVPLGGGGDGDELQQGGGEGELPALLLRAPALPLQSLRGKVNYPLEKTTNKYTITFRYAANEDLLAHLKQEHMAVSRVLKPQYSCARCPANFFKNAFLLKHSLTHTQSKQNL